MIVGIGPLGCIPIVRAMKLFWFKKCSTEVNELIQGYNIKLNMELTLLNENLGHEAVFVYANSYDIFMDIISNHLHYGKHVCMFIVLNPVLNSLKALF